MRFTIILQILFFYFFTNGYTQIFVNGSVHDQKNLPVEFATILLSNQQYNQEKTTNQEGKFEFSIPTGNYKIVITHLGKKILDTTIDFIQDVSLRFSVNIPEDTLETVTISTTKNWLVSEPNKTIILVENTPYKNGFSARDIMQLIPGIIIDQNSISKFGLGEIRVSVNGKISTLTGSNLIDFLRNIPSGLISKIEYNHHTGAIYDAQSSGAMINIVYKTETKPKTSFNTYIEHDQNKYSIQRLGAYYSIFTPKVESYISVNYRNGYENIKEERTLSNNQSNWKGYDNTKKTVDPFTVNFYLNYKITKKTSFGTQLFSNLFNSPQKTAGSYEFEPNLISNYAYKSDGKKHGHLASYSLFLNHTFNEKLQLKVDWDYINSLQDDKRFVKTIRQTGENNIFNHNLFKFDNYSFNTNFTYKLEKISYNWGFKYSLNRTNNLLFSFNQIEAFNFDQEYNVSEEIAAAFVDARYNKNNWFLNVGLRFENTSFIANDYTNTDQYNYSFNRLFPSFSITKSLENSQNISFRYNYGIQRPKFADVTPFRKYYDDNAYTVGNPFLSPQFTHFFEFSSALKNNWNLSLYYALTKNGQAMVFFVDTLTNMQVSQPQNFFTLHNVGTSVSKFHRLSSKWNLIHFAYFYYNTSTFENEYAKIATPFNGFALYYNTQLHYSHKNTFINLSGHLDPPKKAIYFKSKGSYALNAEFDQRLNKIPLKINFQVRDIFNSSPMVHQFRTNGMDQSYYINESSRRVILRLTYYFRQNAQVRQQQSEYNKEAGRYKL